MKKVKAHLQDENDLKRTMMRLAHEIIERNPDLNKMAIVGIRTRGEIIAQRIAKSISDIGKSKIDNGTLDVTFYRDDFRTSFGSPQVGPSDIKFDVTDKNIILIDDVLYTGRTIRAAMDALYSWGRPQRVMLLVMVDRGHRELPIQPDFCGKKVPTSKIESISLRLKNVDNEEGVFLE